MNTKLEVVHFLSNGYAIEGVVVKTEKGINTVEAFFTKNTYTIPVSSCYQGYAPHCDDVKRKEYERHRERLKG